MARNVEIKARLRDLEATRRAVAALADGPPEQLEQRDTFFRVDGGRLKLREIAGTRAELIWYRRPDAPGPTESHFETARVADADACRALLAAALGVRGEVRKHRLVYHIGRTRVHLDEVQDLGSFLELEVQMAAAESAAAGAAEAARLMAALGVEESALVPEAYVDLLERRARAGGPSARRASGGT